MSGLADLHWLASAVAERLLYSMGEGMVLAVVVWAWLRLVPRRNSQTRFVVWFATLLAIAILPLPGASLLGGGLLSGSGETSGAPEHALITVSGTWAVYIFLGWMVIALARLAQVIAAVWQLRKLRSRCELIDPRILGPDAENLIEECRRVRGASIVVSCSVDVPTAVGFFSPVVILPAWLAEETDPEGLRYIVLHELAHLRRHDDWTNLAQKIVKAFLFFHPGVWWIERRLSLDREMACDDAVLAQSGTPKGYAQCLARVAQKSFLRRQLALAQAAVSRMRQLSLRVAQILDVQRPRTTQLWKPAIPLVTVMAVLCAFSAPHLPQLVGFTADVPITSSAQPASHAMGAIHPESTVNTQIGNTHTGVRAWDVALKTDNRGLPVIAHHSSTAQTRSHSHEAIVRRHKPAPRKPDEMTADEMRMLATGLQAPEKAEPLVIQEEVFMVVTSFQATSFQRTSVGQESMQMKVVWQLRVVTSTPSVPKATPRKT